MWTSILNCFWSAGIPTMYISQNDADLSSTKMRCHFTEGVLGWSEGGTYKDYLIIGLREVVRFVGSSWELWEINRMCKITNKNNSIWSRGSGLSGTVCHMCSVV